MEKTIINRNYEIQNAVQAMKQGTSEVQTGLQIAAVADRLFVEIVNATNKVTGQIQDVSSATEQISAGTEELSATVENLSESAGVTAANSLKIEQSIEEQKVSMGIARGIYVQSDGYVGGLTGTDQSIPDPSQSLAIIVISPTSMGIRGHSILSGRLL